VPASRDGDVAWFDNQRVLFYQLKIGKDYKNLLEPFVWDTVKNRVSPYPALQGSRKVKVCGEFVSYIRRKWDVDFINEWLLVYGKIRDGQIVEDQVTEFPNPSTINPFSCRYYSYPYPWMVKGRQTTPLLEEHGHLDWGSSALIPDEKPHVQLYRPGIIEGIPLSLPQGTSNTYQIAYAPFLNAYLIPNSAHANGPDFAPKWSEGQPMPVWWLTPDGHMTEEAVPYHPFMMRDRYRIFLPVKGGIFVYVQDIGLGSSLGHSGGYLARSGITRKLIGGLLRNPVVSPNGCLVAFVHEAEVTTDPSHGRMKIVDLCNGGTHQ